MVKYQKMHFFTAFVFLLSGCSLFDTSKTNDNTQAQISVQSTLITQSEIQIRIESGQEIRTFYNSDFKERENPTIDKATPVVDMPSSGVMNIEFVFADVNSGDNVIQWHDSNRIERGLDTHTLFYGRFKTSGPHRGMFWLP